MDDQLVLSLFSGRVGESFQVVGVEPRLDFELIEAEPLRSRPDGGDPEHQFALLFTGPANRPLEQQIVTLQHESLGELSLFAVPVAERDGQRHYESIVNRIA